MKKLFGSLLVLALAAGSVFAVADPLKPSEALPTDKSVNMYLSVDAFACMDWLSSTPFDLRITNGGNNASDEKSFSHIANFDYTVTATLENLAKEPLAGGIIGTIDPANVNWDVDMYLHMSPGSDDVWEWAPYFGTSFSDSENFGPSNLPIISKVKIGAANISLTDGWGKIKGNVRLSMTATP